MTLLRLYRYNTEPRPALRLFCFPHGGGGLAAYHGWAKCLPAGIEVLSVELPGRDTLIAEPPLQNFDQLIDGVVEQIVSELDRPFVLFGHSLGAITAFELTRRLRSAGQQMPRLLLISGRGAPHLPSRRPEVHHLPEDEFIAELVQLQGTPRSVLESAELMELLLPALRADFAMNESYSYRPEPPLDLPIAAFGGRDDPEVNRAELTAWAEHSLGGFFARTFDGGHFYLQKEKQQFLAVVSDLLARILHPLRF